MANLKLRCFVQFKLDDLPAYVHFLACAVGGQILPYVLNHTKQKVLMEASAYLSTIDSVPTIFKEAKQCGALVRKILCSAQNLVIMAKSELDLVSLDVAVILLFSECLRHQYNL